MIEIKFDASNEDTTTGLTPYMNMLVSSNRDIVKFGLRKIPSFWGYKEEGYIYFMIAPPWTRTPINDVVNEVLVDNSIPKYRRADTNNSSSQSAVTNEAYLIKQHLNERIRNTAESKKPILYSSNVAIK